jgi:hypothetical protein
MAALTALELGGGEGLAAIWAQVLLGLVVRGDDRGNDGAVVCDVTACPIFRKNGTRVRRTPEPSQQVNPRLVPQRVWQLGCVGVVVMLAQRR